MAKRFIDTKIWDKAWFRKLPTKYKLFWVYLLGKCDHAGIWDADWELAEFIIGEPIIYKDLPDVIKEKMEFISGEEQFFIPSFIDFQYGELKEHSKPHMSVLKRLNEKHLKIKGSLRVSNKIDTIKDKDKDKVKVKEKVKTKEIRESEFRVKSFRIGKDLKNVKESTIDGFIDYWTESNMNGTKMKFEMQKTFDIKRRLAKWVNNEKEWNIQKEEKVPFEASFKKTPTGLYKAYCSKCGKREMPNDKWQLKEGSNCCRVDYTPEQNHA